MVRKHIYLDESQLRSARIAAKRKGISFAEFVRRSLADSLASEPVKQPWMRFAGCLGGPKEGSQSLDRDVYDRNAP